MNTFKWLLRREYWENKGGIYWAPAVVSVLAILLGVVLAIAFTWGIKSGNMNNDGVAFTSLAPAMNAESLKHATEAVASAFAVAFMPVCGILFFVMFFYFTGSLYDDRNDRSFLFWKSLPISDRATVISKAFTGLVTAPLIAIAIATVSGIVLTLIALAFFGVNGVNLVGGVLTESRLYTLPLEFVASLPVYILWALPTAGWLMMVSAWARRLPFLWAVGAPVISGILISWAIWIVGMFGVRGDHSFFWQHIAGRSLLSILPGSWGFLLEDPGQYAARSLEHGSPLASTYNLLASPDLWIGAVVGAAMIAYAVRLRATRDDS